MTAPATAALAVIPQSFEPKDLAEAKALASTLATSMLIPDALKNKPADVFVMLLSGHELGLSPMQSIRSIAVIKGKPSLSADLMAALVQRRRDVCSYWRLVESTPLKATFETLRVGHKTPTSMSYTIDEARAAGLVTPGGMFTKYPAAMLRARCIAALARAVYPDLLLGVYEESEGAEMAANAAPAPQHVAPPKPALQVVDPSAPDERPEPPPAADQVQDVEFSDVSAAEEPPEMDPEEKALMEAIGAAPDMATLKTLMQRISIFSKTAPDKYRAAGGVKDSYLTRKHAFEAAAKVTE